MILALETIKDYLSETGTDNDAIISDLIKEAESTIKNYIGSPIEEETITEIRNGSGEQVFTLKKFPVTALTSFEYNTGTIATPAWTAFDNTLYRLEAGQGQIYTLGGIPKGLGNIKIVYKAGYADGTIPDEIKLAIKRLVAYLWNSRKTAGIRSESVDGSSATYQDPSTTNGIDTQILDKYRSFNV